MYSFTVLFYIFYHFYLTIFAQFRPHDNAFHTIVEKKVLFIATCFTFIDDTGGCTGGTDILLSGMFCLTTGSFCIEFTFGCCTLFTSVLLTIGSAFCVWEEILELCFYTFIFCFLLDCVLTDSNCMSDNNCLKLYTLKDEELFKNFISLAT